MPEKISLYFSINVCYDAGVKKRRVKISFFRAVHRSFFPSRQFYNSEHSVIRLGAFSLEVSELTEKEFCQTRQWKAMRKAVLRRDKFLCVDCKRYGRLTQATTVHHIKHYDEYPELALEPSNLVSLCASCHNIKHPEKGGARKY